MTNIFGYISESLFLKPSLVFNVSQHEQQSELDIPCIAESILYIDHKILHHMFRDTKDGAYTQIETTDK